MLRQRSTAVLFLLALLSTPPLTAAADNRVIDPDQARLDEKNSTAWYDAKLLPIEGKGWNDTAAFYDRLPARAENKVRPPVWALSHHSAGMCVRFRTDSKTIKAHWKLLSARLEMAHMPATGVSGLDLYVRHDGRWRWLAVGRPTAQENTATLYSSQTSEPRDYLLYFPLYNGLQSLEIGINQSAELSTLEADPAVARKPIVFWGTSITQGGCASRPGMVHTAILGRRLDRPVINLGFSGNGRLEPEMAELLAELDPAVFVLDCLPNLNPEQVAERTEPAVKILRQHRPTTPILLVEDRTYSSSFLNPSQAQRNSGNRKSLQAAYERLQAAGVKGLHYLDGETLLGDDGDDTVDGSHPTDLGFYRQANAFEPVLREILDER